MACDGNDYHKGSSVNPDLIPLLNLEQRILNAQPAIEHWFRAQWQEHTIPFYTSVDLRNSGFKPTPLVSCLYPCNSWSETP